MTHVIGLNVKVQDARSYYNFFSLFCCSSVCYMDSLELGVRASGVL